MCDIEDEYREYRNAHAYNPTTQSERGPDTDIHEFSDDEIAELICTYAGTIEEAITDDLLTPYEAARLAHYAQQSYQQCTWTHVGLIAGANILIALALSFIVGTILMYAWAGLQFALRMAP